MVKKKSSHDLKLVLSYPLGSAHFWDEFTSHSSYGIIDQ